MKVIDKALIERRDEIDRQARTLWLKTFTESHSQLTSRPRVAGDDAVSAAAGQADRAADLFRDKFLEAKEAVTTVARWHDDET